MHPRQLTLHAAVAVLWLPSGLGLYGVYNSILHHLPVLFPQADDPPEAVGPYLYHTHFTPQGTQTVLRSSSSDNGIQQEQVVVSDGTIQRDMADTQRLTGLQLTGAGDRAVHVCVCLCCCRL